MGGHKDRPYGCLHHKEEMDKGGHKDRPYSPTHRVLRDPNPPHFLGKMGREK
jgi:hypothetical protein